LDAPPQLIDLTAFYNKRLDARSWYCDSPLDTSFAGLPGGLQEFDGIRFDVRGIVQLNGLEMAKSIPDITWSVEGVQVNLLARRLHFLGGVDALFSSFTPGAPVGSCVIHYADGQQAVFPWRARKELDNIQYSPHSSRANTDSTVVWTGMSCASESQNCRLRIMKTTWENPRPEVKIVSIDLKSEKVAPAPLIIAVTAE
ncbi:MAG TPA: hypothetical protein VMB21_01685, partial [Candidatus Limnocylindria bacterium]|nr:hypothetical protein [Candidatus Limnocylindria bacterium]